MGSTIPAPKRPHSGQLCLRPASTISVRKTAGYIGKTKNLQGKSFLPYGYFIFKVGLDEEMVKSAKLKIYFIATLSPVYAGWNSTFGSQGYCHLNLDFIWVKQL